MKKAMKAYKEIVPCAFVAYFLSLEMTWNLTNNR